MGILSIEGIIDLSQFWPKGKSDADTTKIIIDVEKGCFKYNGKTTSCYDDAFVSTSQDKDTIKKYGEILIKKGGRVTVRLQGIDAPELHYRDYDPGNYKILKGFNEIEYRQYLAETCVKRLVKFLKQCSFKKNFVKCYVVSEVEKPAEVWDVYGRFVGDIIVTDKAKNSININHWLIENGYAFPSIYDSMTVPEIKQVLKVAKKAKKNKSLVWKYHSPFLDKFNNSVTYRVVEEEKISDKGKVVFPKLFRRQCIHYIHTYAGQEDKDLYNFIRSKAEDTYFLTKEFVNKGKESQKFQLGDALEESLKFKFSPEEITINENNNFLLVTSEGQVIEKWKVIKKDEDQII